MTETFDLQLMTALKKWTPEKIKALRNRLGLTQLDFAERLGYSRRESVAELEKGEYSPSGSAMVLLDLMEKEADRLDEERTTDGGDQ